MLTAYRKDTRETIFASPGIDCVCPDCGEPLISKCGQIKIWHFAHKTTGNCDLRFYDGMSEWHTQWQHTINNPIAGINVEVYIRKDEYAKRADLVTPSGLIVEFQKSTLPLPERIIREAHYKNMIWVVHEDLSSSATWKTKPSGVRILTDTPSGLYDPVRNFTIPKSRFVRTIINGRNTGYEVWDKLKARCTAPPWKKYEAYQRSGISALAMADITTYSDMSLKSRLFNIPLIMICFWYYNYTYNLIVTTESKRLKIIQEQINERRMFSDPQLLQISLKQLQDSSDSEIYNNTVHCKHEAETSLHNKLLQEMQIKQRDLEFQQYLSQAKELKEKQNEQHTIELQRYLKQIEELKEKQLEQSALDDEQFVTNTIYALICRCDKAGIVFPEHYELLPTTDLLELCKTLIVDKIKETRRLWFKKLSYELLAKGYHIVNEA